MAKKKDEPTYLEEMVWKPGVGPDSSRLRELMVRFGKPRVPLGEAWFMGETRYLYDELNAGGIDAVSDEYLGAALDELISGMMCFPEMTDWAPWYAYLMPRVLGLERFMKRDMWGVRSVSWYSALCEGFLALCRSSANEYVISYKNDFVAVLSPWVMSGHFWNRGRNIALHENQEWRTSWGQAGLKPDISLSLLLTWGNVAPSALRGWLHSVLEIEDVYWRSHFIFWLLKVRPAFEQGDSNSALVNFREIFGGLGVSGLSTILIPAENVAALQVAIREEFDEKWYMAMIEQFSGHPDLWPQMESALGTLQEEYL
ncbi:hypothetical protein EON83_22940 [bacterium]|nr:MAG: hypothetical protein EON83_22940 [bacterium]